MLEKILLIIRGYFETFPIMISACILLVLTIFVSNLLAKTIKYLLPKAMNESLKYFIVKIFRIAFCVISGILILSSFGISSTSITAMIGVSTLAIGTSLRDVFINSINGITVLVGEHINVGDTVTICGSTGKIIKIDLIYTIIDCDGEIKFIPNTKMLNEIISVKK